MGGRLGSCTDAGRTLAGRLLSEATRAKLGNALSILELRSRLPKRQGRTSSGTGINIVGDFAAETGLGEAARSTLRALETTHIDLSVHNFSLAGNARSTETVDGRHVTTLSHDTNIFHMNPNQLVRDLKRLSSFFESRYNIASWSWEVGRIPRLWRAALRSFDEIWISSDHGRDLVLQDTNLPVTTIPISVQPRINRSIDRRRLNLPEHDFIFLAMADFFSIPERKNPVAIVEAFERSFGRNPKGVCLVLKVKHTSFHPEMGRIMREYAERNRSILLMDGYVDRQIVNALIHNCDTFVSLHRAEGFGLPIAEAMYMGKPVIATGWSGNMQFMNTENSLPVDYRLVQLSHDVGPYEKGSVWAEPDLDHAGELMKMVVQDLALATTLGRRAMNQMRTEFSEERIGRLILERLSTVARQSRVGR